VIIPHYISFDEMSATGAEPCDPLMLIVRMHTRELTHDGPARVLEECDEVAAAFLAGALSQDCAAHSFETLIGNSAPIEKLGRILKVSDTPLPSAEQSSHLQSPMSSSRKKNDPWTDYEDTRVLAGVRKYGLDAWGSIANFVGNSRTSAQCCQRWVRGLDPRISRQPWTAEEDAKLFILVQTLGTKAWTRISSEFGNRCDVQCRYRYQLLFKKGSFVAIAPQAAKKELAPPPAERPRFQLPSIHDILAACGAPAPTRLRFAGLVE
jgi:hypothetical protein